MCLLERSPSEAVQPFLFLNARIAARAFAKFKMPLHAALSVVPVAGVGRAHVEPVAGLDPPHPPTKSFRSVAVAAIVEAYAAGDALREEW